MASLPRLPVLLATFALSGAAQAGSPEFKAIGAAPVIMYDAPSIKGGKLYVAPRGMPVEVVLGYGSWSKVRDVAGDLSWVESKDLVARRNVVVKAVNAKVRASADEGAALIFSADKYVLLEMAEPVSAGWVKVKHRDGQIGYVRVNEVWGI